MNIHALNPRTRFHQNGPTAPAPVTFISSPDEPRRRSVEDALILDAPWRPLVLADIVASSLAA